MSQVLESFLSTHQSLDAFSDRNFVRAMLRFEAALAKAQGVCGVIPISSADAIVATCQVDLIDVKRVIDEGGRAGSLAIPLVKALRETVALFNPGAAEHAHFGSTSQDVIDTAMAIVSQPVLCAIAADTRALARSLLQLAALHADSPVLARTLMQPASVTSFGLKCIHWAAPLVRSVLRLECAVKVALCVQVGGAIGTSRAYSAQADAVGAMVASHLGLSAPAFCWHTQRDQWVLVACELGILTGCVAKIAQDLALMGQFEVAEAFEPTEPGRGGSSAMPHKRNPVAAMVARAAALRVPHRVAAILGSMAHEHERALGGWQAELAEWPGLLASTHGAVQAMAYAAAHLQVEPERMLANVNAIAKAVSIDVATEWFSPSLAAHAAVLTKRHHAALTAQLNVKGEA